MAEAWNIKGGIIELIASRLRCKSVTPVREVGPVLELAVLATRSIATTSRGKLTGNHSFRAPGLRAWDSTRERWFVKDHPARPKSQTSRLRNNQIVTATELKEDMQKLLSESWYFRICSEGEANIYDIYCIIYLLIVLPICKKAASTFGRSFFHGESWIFSLAIVGAASNPSGKTASLWQVPSRPTSQFTERGDWGESHLRTW